MANCEKCQPIGCKNAQCDRPDEFESLPKNCGSICRVLSPNGKGDKCQDLGCPTGRKIDQLGLGNGVIFPTGRKED